jgi:probable F420-dependent oxidoreductase
MLHPSTILAYLAGVTSTIKLGTGIVLIAQRNPLVLAKEIASLDVVTQGRLIFGIGAGYLKAEFDALGIEFSERGARTDEYIEVLRNLWQSDNPEFSGKFTRFSAIQSRPRPAREGGPPIVVGGASPAALRRAVQKCHGWYGFALDLDSTTTCIAGLQEAAKKYERPAGLGELEISITPRHRLTPDQVSQYEDAGVSKLILLQPGSNQQDLIDYLNNTAEQLM